jgi:hypothetical protein
MAVVIVGDFPDCSKVADLIKQYMGDAFPAPHQRSSSSSSRQQQQQQQGPERPLLPSVSPDSWQHAEPR